MKKIILVLALYLAISGAQATVIVENQAYNEVTSGADFALAQSLTTSPGGTWNNIQFHFIDTGGLPYALGTLYLLTGEYLGTPAGLSSTTPGFVAASTGTGGGIWTFDTAVVLQASTSYWFYMDSLFDGTAQVRFSSDNPYAGGSSYQADGLTENFTYHFNKTDYHYDLAFVLQGNPMSTVPEPGSLLLIGCGLLGLILARRR